MSSLYNLEPQPTAKVILQTTSGDISLELFAKQTPLASRNFLQHCLDGYYTNTIFHRLVSGFIIQGGDPTGSGSGGISAINDGQGFEDEFHSRLKFNRRGLLGMANEGADSNASQFFFTLGATPELQNKNTMFGRVEGDTIYNLMKMADAELVEGEGSERPLYPTKITGAEVLVNPFEDMVVRVKEAPRTRDDDKKDTKKRKKTAGKNVLSFGGDDEGEDGDMPVIKKSKVNPKFVSTVSEDIDEPAAPKEKKEKPRKRKSSSPEPPIAAAKEPAIVISRQSQPVKRASPSPSISPEPEQSKRMSKLEQTNAEIAALKASMKRGIDSAPKQKEKPKSALEAMIPANSTRGRKRGKATDEKGAFDLFQSFKRRLDDIPTETAEPISKSSATNGDSHPTQEPTNVSAGAEDDEATLCDLHFIANCQSCAKWADDEGGDAEADDDGDEKWMSHQLTFAKDTLGKDLQWKKNMQDIEVIDPREKARAIKEEQRKGRDKGKGKAKA